MIDRHTDDRQIYYKKLAQRTMGFKKSQDLPFVHWRPRRATGIVPVLSKGLRTRRTNARSLMRAGED